MTSLDDNTRQRLIALQTRLNALHQTRRRDDYGNLLRFFVAILPRLMSAERCTIFIVEPGTERIWSLLGTGLKEREIEAPRDDSIVGRTISSGRWIIANDLGESEGYHQESDAHTGFATRALVCAPIKSPAGYGVTGAIQILNPHRHKRFEEQDAAFLQEAADHIALALENIIVNREIRRVSEGLEAELDQLASQTRQRVGFIAESDAMRQLLATVQMVSTTPVDVLVQGENGTGKELVARMIHDNSDRQQRPFVAVNCASIPEALMESEFFGYEKGAFTGAHGSRAGRFEEASGGTLFLDEVADMPPSIQPKFLRAIQEGEGSRLGNNRVHRYDLRIIGASNRSLRDAVKAGRFREDLYYRLFAVEIDLPPLRDRREDIAPLAHAFLADVAKRFNRPASGFDPAVLQAFERHAWPGNVRQLRREVERLVALTAPGAPLGLDACSPEFRIEPSPVASSPANGLSLPEQVRALEIALIRRALGETGGHRVRAAQLLGITRQGLHKKLQRYGLNIGNSFGHQAVR